MTYKIELKIKDFIDNKIHLGHRSGKLNPQAKSYVLGIKNGICIIDVKQTAKYLANALNMFYKYAKEDKKILFVGTSAQIAPVIKEYAERCGQYYINEKWLGGILTNWYTVSKSIRTLKSYAKILEEDYEGLTKKELLLIRKKHDRLKSVFGGIMNMGSRPDIVFITSATKDYLAVAEASSLGIPVVTVVDSDASIKNINFPIPGNDDSINSIKFFCQKISDAILHGIRENIKHSGINVDNIVKKTHNEDNKK